MYEAESVALKGVSMGSAEFAGRFKITVPPVVASGALCAVCRLRSWVVPVLNAPVVTPVAVVKGG